MDEDTVPATPKRKATPLFFDSDDDEEGHIAPRTVSPRSQHATKRARLQDETLVDCRASENGRLIGDPGDIMADGVGAQSREEAATDERVLHEPASLDIGAPLARMVYGGESGHVPLVPPQVQHSLPTVESVTTRSPTKLNLQTRLTLSPLAFWDQSHSKRPTPSSFSVLHKSILASRLQRPTPVAPTPAPPPAEPAVPTPWHTSIRQTNEKSLALSRPRPALPRIHEPVAQRPAHDNNAVASSSEHRPTPPTSPSPSIISISDEPEVISIHSTPSSSPPPMAQDEPELTPSEEHYMINADNRIVVLKSDGRNYYPNALVAEYDEINEYHLVERHDDMSKHWRAKLGLYLAREGLKRKRKVHSPPWMLAKFPRGYNLYVHVKGLQRDKFNARKDYYLYGSDNVFRSPEEFAFHLIWLAKGMPTTRDGRRRCGCKYCSHRSQTEITVQLRKYLPSPPPVLANSRGYNTHHQPVEQRARSPELMFKDYTYLARS